MYVCDSAFTHSYDRTGATLNPKPAEIVYTSLVRVLPGWLIDPLDSVVASRTYSMPRTFRALAHRISKDIIQKAVDDVEGHGEKDIVGLLGILRSFH